MKDEGTKHEARRDDERRGILSRTIQVPRSISFDENAFFHFVSTLLSDTPPASFVLVYLFLGYACARTYLHARSTIHDRHLLLLVRFVPTYTPQPPPISRSTRTRTHSSCSYSCSPPPARDSFRSLTSSPASLFVIPRRSAFPLLVQAIVLAP
ncbi:hypothetical protein PILCRDRAFT_658259 [Piloderma croceum F 1598]|uniref:Uncharacterized protein n=1 Tax=Piloderma croceum (strain F 1598) TaxID=765440 RepID=A0A0C3AQ77_PILCF|nr:hypothetical protein PILCRDRAFT_658259 [Piloderma croceum F 1598]